MHVSQHFILFYLYEKIIFNIKIHFNLISLGVQFTFELYPFI